jgi:chromate reductase
MPDRLRIFAFAGSLRRYSYNRGLIEAAAELAPDTLEFDIFDLNPLPLYNADVEAQGTPEAVQAFKEKMLQADALLIATPEYNYSITGVLKNAIDWASRRMSPSMPPPLFGKPAAIMGAGGRFGTVRAQQHLRYILLHNDVKVLNKPELMLPRASELFDDQGRLADQAARDQVRDVVLALEKWTRLLHLADQIQAVTA